MNIPANAIRYVIQRLSGSPRQTAAVTVRASGTVSLWDDSIVYPPRVALEQAKTELARLRARVPSDTYRLIQRVDIVIDE